MSPSRIRIVKRTPLKRVSVIGLGLMGGSLALALRRAGLASHIVGCGRQVLVERAIEMGAIDSGCQDACEAVAGSDYVFLCTPVETSIALMAQVAPHLREGAVVTDVGSTKAAFAAAARPAIEAGSKVSLAAGEAHIEPSTRVWIGKDENGRSYIGWIDKTLQAEQDAWVKQYGE